MASSSAIETAHGKKRRRNGGDEGCKLIGATGERCTFCAFHAGPHSFDQLVVSADINAWHRAWPGTLTLEYNERDGAEAFDGLIGVYEQTREIMWRRPIYEHESGAVLCFDRSNAWVVRHAYANRDALTLKDAARTPDRSKRPWRRVGADGKLVDVPGLRCVAGERRAPPPPEQQQQQQHHTAAQDDALAAYEAATAAEGEEAAIEAAAAQEIAAFLDQSMDDDWVE